MLDAPGGPGIDLAGLEPLHLRLHVGDDLHPVFERQRRITGDDRVRPVGTPEYPLDLDDPVAFSDAVEQPPAGDDPADDATVGRGAVVGGMPHACEDQVGPGGVVAAAPEDDVAPLIPPRRSCGPDGGLKRPEGGGVAVLPVQAEPFGKPGRKKPRDRRRIHHLDDHIARRRDEPDLLRLGRSLPECRADDGDAAPHVPSGEDLPEPGARRDLDTFSIQVDLHHPYLRRERRPPSPVVHPP